MPCNSVTKLSLAFMSYSYGEGKDEMQKFYLHVLFRFQCKVYSLYFLLTSSISQFLALHNTSEH